MAEPAGRRHSVGFAWWSNTHQQSLLKGTRIEGFLFPQDPDDLLFREPARSNPFLKEIAGLRSGKLKRYIEELTARYPDKFLHMLRKDLGGEKEFLAAIQELEIDESSSEDEFEDESQLLL